MPLVLALKNRDTVVVAGDIDQPGATSSGFSQLIQLPNRSVLLIAGNLDAVRHVVTDTVIPRITSDLGAAGLAQILHAALVLELVPHLSQLKGRVEFIVAGIDPIRHIEEPGLYYLDSAQGFNLTLVKGDAVAAGSTAAISSLLQGHSFAGSTIDQLKVLAKECVSATKLRWPAALANHLRLGVITAQNTRFQDF
jgi:20S proteasome alpha/beta subunit